jgi:hypothetical protein
MAVFTAIATAIVTSITGAAVVAGTWAAFAVSVVATGLAAVTSRLINGTGARGGGGTQNQGVRVQLPPATDNKVPIVYGRAYQQGVITDARISNSNQNMTYVIVLSEYVEAGSWSVGRIYWNDQELVFKATAADSHIVESSIQADTITNTNLADKVKVRVYAGSSASTDQIFPLVTATNQVNAYDFIPNENSAYQMTDLVFAVIEITYDQEKGITGLPTMTFELSNSLKNPALVWYDYITNSRYGAGFTATEINTVTSINTLSTTSVYSISNQIPANQFARFPEFDQTSTATTASTLVRYEINGVLNTGDTAKTNLEKINLASATWTTYDHKSGQWKLLPNWSKTNDELAAAFRFSDDNIIGEISLTATNLEDLYNRVEFAYASRAVRDQTDYYRETLDQGLMNQLEPVNLLQMSSPLINNYLQAGRIAHMELLQSRSDLVITFTADYGALVCEVGDVVKVSNPIYGFENKLFRITRVRETEGEDSALACEITAIEYTSSIYADTTLTDLTYKPISDIPSSQSSSSLPAPSAPVASTGTGASSIVLQTTIASGSQPLDSVDFYYSNTNTGSVNWLTTVGGNFVAGMTVEGSANTLPAGTYYFRARTGQGSSHSDLSAWSSAFYTSGPFADYGDIGGGGGGA